VTVSPAQREFNGRLLGSIVLWAIGLWFTITQHAKFTLGGRRTRPGMPVNAFGLDAIAIGCFFLSLGIINLALGIRGERRIPVFWAGAGLFCASVLYGLVKAGIAVASLFTA
jgi:hypothetical protein